MSNSKFITPKYAAGLAIQQASLFVDEINSKFQIANPIKWYVFSESLKAFLTLPIIIIGSSQQYSDIQKEFGYKLLISLSEMIKDIADDSLKKIIVNPKWKEDFINYYTGIDEGHEYLDWLKKNSKIYGLSNSEGKMSLEKSISRLFYRLNKVTEDESILGIELFSIINTSLIGHIQAYSEDDIFIP